MFKNTGFSKKTDSIPQLLDLPAQPPLIECLLKIVEVPLSKKKVAYLKLLA